MYSKFSRCTRISDVSSLGCSRISDTSSVGVPTQNLTKKLKINSIYTLDVGQKSQKYDILLKSHYADAHKILKKTCTQGKTKGKIKLL